MGLNGETWYTAGWHLMAETKYSIHLLFLLLNRIMEHRRKCCITFYNFLVAERVFTFFSEFATNNYKDEHSCFAMAVHMSQL